MISPTCVISRVVVSPVEWVSAFGGVEIGKSIAKEVDRATPTNKVNSSVALHHQ